MVQHIYLDYLIFFLGAFEFESWSALFECYYPAVANEVADGLGIYVMTVIFMFTRDTYWLL